jgi:acyl-ACP thioesterase
VKPRHRQSFRVRWYETDQQGRLRPPVLCRLLQEAATAHAAELGVAVETLIGGGVAWVLSRLKLAVNRWPRAEDEVVVETWPAAANRLFTERRFEVLDGSGTIIGTAATLWFILDLETRRPVRFPATVLDALGRLNLESTPMRPEELDPPDPGDTEVGFTIRRSDLDLAGHVNNTSYVEWVVEAVPDPVWAANHLAELEIAFLSECRHGSSVVSTSQTSVSGGGFEIRHRVTRRGGGEEVARARSVWRASE